MCIRDSPICFLLSATTYALSFISLKREHNGERYVAGNNRNTGFWKKISGVLSKYRLVFDRNRKRILIFSGVIVLCFFILSPKYITPRDSALGGGFTLSQMKNMPEFYDGGRRPILPFTSLFTLFYKRINDPLVSYFIIIFIIFLRKRIKKLPGSFWYLIIASMLLYRGACLFAYRLYIPERYVQFSIPIFLFAFLAINIPNLVDRIKFRSIKIGFIALFLLLTYHWYGSKMYAGLSQVSHTRQSLYEFISGLPRDVLLAGHPRDMDEIPLFSHRKVLVTYELTNPHLVGYYSEIKERTSDFFGAYYSGNWSEIIEFCDKYKIDYLVINREHFSERYLAEGEFYFEPFNTSIQEKIEMNKDFILTKPYKDIIVFEKDSMFVLDTKRLEESAI